MVLYRYLQTILQQGIDVLVMGCTHYPILRDSIQKIAGQDVQLVDASIGLIAEIEKSVKRRQQWRRNSDCLHRSYLPDWKN